MSLLDAFKTFSGGAWNPPDPAAPPEEPASLLQAFQDFATKGQEDAKQFLWQRAQQEDAAAREPERATRDVGISGLVKGLVRRGVNPAIGKDSGQQWDATEAEFKKQFPGLEWEKFQPLYTEASLEHVQRRAADDWMSKSGLDEYETTPEGGQKLRADMAKNFPRLSPEEVEERAKSVRSQHMTTDVLKAAVSQDAGVRNEGQRSVAGTVTDLAERIGKAPGHVAGKLAAPDPLQAIAARYPDLDINEAAPLYAKAKEYAGISRKLVNAGEAGNAAVKWLASKMPDDDRNLFASIMGEVGKTELADKSALARFHEAFQRGTVQAGEKLGTFFGKQIPGIVAEQKDTEQEKYAKGLIGLRRSIEPKAKLGELSGKSRLGQIMEVIGTVGSHGAMAATEMAPPMLAGMGVSAAATVVGGPKAGLAAGFAWWYPQATAGMYEDLRSKGFSHANANTWSLIAGIPHALIESFEAKGLVDAAKALSVKQSLGSTLRKFGTAYAEQMGQEATQEVFELLAKELANVFDRSVKIDYAKEIGDSAKNLMTAAAALPFMLAPGASMQMGKAAGQAVGEQYEKVIAGPRRERAATAQFGRDLEAPIDGPLGDERGSTKDILPHVPVTTPAKDIDPNAWDKTGEVTPVRRAPETPDVPQGQMAAEMVDTDALRQAAFKQGISVPPVEPDTPASEAADAALYEREQAGNPALLAASRLQTGFDAPAAKSPEAKQLGDALRWVGNAVTRNEPMTGRQEAGVRNILQNYQGGQSDYLDVLKQAYDYYTQNRPVESVAEGPKTAAGPAGQGFEVQPPPAYEGAGMSIEEILAKKKAGLAPPKSDANVTFAPPVRAPSQIGKAPVAKTGFVGKVGAAKPKQAAELAGRPPGMAQEPPKPWRVGKAPSKAETAAPAQSQDAGVRGVFARWFGEPKEGGRELEAAAGRRTMRADVEGRGKNAIVHITFSYTGQAEAGAIAKKLPEPDAVKFGRDLLGFVKDIGKLGLRISYAADPKRTKTYENVLKKAGFVPQPQEASEDAGAYPYPVWAPKAETAPPVQSQATPEEPERQEVAADKELEDAKRAAGEGEETGASEASGVSKANADADAGVVDRTIIPFGDDPGNVPGDAAGDRVAALKRIGERVDAGLAKAELPPAKKLQYGKALSDVFGRMTDKMVAMLDSLGATFEFYADNKAVTDAFNAVSQDRQIAAGHTIAGFVDQNPAGPPVVHLDGGSQALTMRGVYVHELFHLPHKNGLGKESDPAWMEAWNEELAQGQLNAHSAKKPKEGFAEFGRMLVEEKRSHASIRAKFPKTFAYFEQHGLVPTEQLGLIAGTFKKITDIFRGFIETPTALADIPLAGAQPLPPPEQAQEAVEKVIADRIANADFAELREIIQSKEKLEGTANPNALIDAAKKKLKAIRAGTVKVGKAKKVESAADFDIRAQNLLEKAPLDSREKYVVKRLTEGASLTQVADDWFKQEGGKKLSSEWIRRIAEKAYEKMAHVPEVREAMDRVAAEWKGESQPVGLRKYKEAGERLEPGEKPGKGPRAGELAATGGTVIPKTPAATGEKVSRHDIIREAAKKFGTNVRWKRIREGLAGVYKKFPEVLRLAGRYAGNLAVFSHELAHDISKKNGNPVDGATPKAVAEIENMDYDKKRLARLGEVRKKVAALQRIAHRTAGQDARIAKLQKFETELAALVREEGWSEFFRHWAAVGDASFHAPQFDAYFHTWLAKHPEIAENMEWLRGRIDAWKAAGPQGRLVLSTTGKVAKTLWEKVKAVWQRVKTGFDDRLDPLWQIQKEAQKRLGRTLTAEEMPYVLARVLANKPGAKAAHAFKHGIWDDVSGSKLADGMADWLAEMTPEQQNIFDEYLVAAQAKERWEKRLNREDELQQKKRWQKLTDEEQAELDNPDEPGVDYDDAVDIVAKLESEYEPYAKKFRKFHNGLVKMLVHAGHYTAKEGRAIIRSYRYYSPMMRVQENELTVGKHLSHSILRIQNPVHFRKGGDQQIISPLRVTALMAERAYDVAGKSLIAKAIKNLGDRVEGMGDIIEEVEGAPSKEDNTIKLGDKTYWIRPDLYKALMDQDPLFMYPTINAVFGTITKIKKAGAVGWRPGFGLLFNPIRDLPTGMIRTKTGGWRPDHSALRNIAEAVFLSPGKQGLRTLANWFYRLPRAMLTGKIDPVMDLYKRWGGSQAGFYGQEVETGHKKIVEFINEAKDRQIGGIRTSVVLNPWQYLKAMLKVFAASEAGPRLAEIEGMLAERGITRKMLEKGYKLTLDDMAVVALAAQDVTQDFGRGGDWLMAYSKIAAFANARYQGISQFAKAVKERPGTIIARGVIGITIPSLAYWFMYKDDDRWKELPWWLKFNFWNFFSRDKNNKSAASVPMPHDLGTVFAALPVAMADYAYQKDPTAVKEWFKAAFPMTHSGMSWLNQAPDLMKLPIELAFAHSLWRDRPLMNEDLKRREPFDQYHSYTTETAKYLGYLLSKEEGGVRTGGLSPILIDHTINELTGGLGGDILGGKSKGVGKLLGYGRLEQDVSKGQSIDDFYEQKKQVDSAYNTAHKSGKDVPSALAERHRKFDAAADKMSDLRKKLQKGQIDRQTANERITGLAREVLGKPSLAAYSKESRK